MPTASLRVVRRVPHAPAIIIKKFYIYSDGTHTKIKHHTHKRGTARPHTGPTEHNAKKKVFLPPGLGLLLVSCPGLFYG
jgi:hypothetical protein